MAYRIHEILDTVPEKQKLELPYLKGNIQKAIQELVYEKREDRIAFNTYYGRRDDRELQHLTDNFGVGVPSEIPSMRLMARRINRLVGKAMQNTFDYYVTCSNVNALDMKMQQKKYLILNELKHETERHINNVISGKTVQADPISEAFLERLKKKYNDSWQADFEIAAQDFLTRIIDSKEMQRIFSEVFKDLPITGQMYVRSFVRELGKDPEFWRCDPEDFFYEPNPNSLWIEDCRRVVYRRFMSPAHIIKEYGHLMTDDDRKKIAQAITGYYNDRYQQEHLFVEGRYGERIAIGQKPRYEADLVEVYHVEWIGTNETDGDYDAVDNVESKLKNVKKKKRFRKDRYEGFRAEIGGGIYFGMGKSKHVNRSVDDPYDCKLSYNGLVYGRKRNSSFYENKYLPTHDQPFSFILATKDVSDIYDITHFHLNNLLAAARPGGTITVLEHLPIEWGKTPEERLLKATGYEKTLSQKLISLSQEGNMPGEMGTIPFNNYGQYNSNLDGNLVQSFIAYLDNLEQQADRMLGLNSHMMGEMEERDGKATTMQAIQQGELLNKEMFKLYSSLIKKTLTNLANLSRISYKDGHFGSYVVGENHKMFVIDPTTYSLADFNVFISDDIEENQDTIKLDEMIKMSIGSQLANSKDLFQALMERSITRKKKVLFGALDEQDGSVGKRLEETVAQNEELQKQLEELSKKLEKFKQIEQGLDQGKLELEREKFEHDKQIDKKKVEDAKKNADKKNQIEKQKINVELTQLMDDSAKNDEVNWSK